jgi:TonB family protein
MMITTAVMTTVPLRATLVLAAAFFLSLVLRRSPAALRHAVWSAALLGLLALPLLAALLPAWELAVVPAWRSAASAGAVSVAASSASSSWPNHALWLLWAMGALVVLARLGRDVQAASSLARSARPFRLPGSADMPVRAGTSDRVRVPLAWGVWRPVVLFPAGAERWAEGLRRSVLAHELAHVARRDIVMLLAARVACAVYWFHPLVWAGARRLALEAERACDDRVLLTGVRASDYAGHLLEMTRSLGLTRTLPAPALFAGPRSVETRVAAILDAGRSRRPSWSAAAALALSTTAAVIAIAVAQPMSAQPLPDAAPVIQDVVVPPRLLERAPIEYTADARERRVEGDVLLLVTIEQTGKVSEVTVERGIDAGLDRNAADSVGTWRFEPGKRNGEPVKVQAHVTVRFRLE